MPSRVSRPPARLSLPRSAGKPYHHGDLRTALITAARAALDAHAPEEVSLKGLALRLGVSQPAPYRHFGSREALLAAVAIQGFEEFCLEIAPTGTLNAHDDFVQGCDAYLRFAQKNRGLYRLMFASSIVKNSGSAELSKAAAAAFTIVTNRVQRCAGSTGADINAIWVWSTLHGLAMLEAEKLTGPLAASLPSAQVIRRMVDTLVKIGKLVPESERMLI